MERVCRVQLDWAAPESVARHLAGQVGGLWVLDYGCGTGVLLERMAEAAFRVGVDVSSAALLKSRQRLGPRVALVRIGGRGPLPFHTGIFDLVTTTEVLEHVPDERIMLAEITRVLKPGGRLVLTTPHRHWLSPLDLGNLKFRFPRAHAVYWKRIRGLDQAAYVRRFRGEQGLIGDISVQQHPWHRHYRLEQLSRLTAGLMELERVFIFGPWARLIMPLQLAVRPWLPGLSRILFKLDHRWRRSFNRQGYDICIVARKPADDPANCTTER